MQTAPVSPKQSVGVTETINPQAFQSIAPNLNSYSESNMIRHLPALLGIVLLLGSCTNDEPAKATLSWAGVYETVTPDRRNEGLSKWRKEKRTSKIPNELGTRFGIEYVLDGNTINPLVQHRFIWRYPTPGQINPETSATAGSYVYEHICFTGETCRAGYTFDMDWEMVPGVWYAEVWVDDKRVLQKALNVQGAQP